MPRYVPLQIVRIIVPEMFFRCVNM
jgi:hypothetical protein